MKLVSTPTVQNFVRLVCIGVKDLYATDSSTIVKLILTISEMNDMPFHSHQLTRNTVDLSFL